MRAKIARKEHFNAAYRLHNPEWSEQKNHEIFGPYNNPNYHGCNFDLEVQVIGEIDPTTGYVMRTEDLATLVKTYVLNKFDHKNLNLDLKEFEQLNPTIENIAMVIWQILRERLDSKFDLKIRLYETERNFVEFPAS
ncbi:MAG TPA: 6-pyruvoyl tetrahydrobiopterin synthase [Microscillaceae bacterium]|nr:6-pyruvoyl tetrahydrobiopterin synthase [Microscillaceae bacterium]